MLSNVLLILKIICYNSVLSVYVFWLKLLLLENLLSTFYTLLKIKLSVCITYFHFIF